VAQLAGISTTWYVRIEQGREVSASAAALDRLARALQLGSAERAHLFALAERRDPLAGTATGDEARLGTLQRMIAAIAVPAYALDRHWNARAWNEPAARLFQKWLSAPEPNLLRYVFLDREAHALIVDWPDRARRLVAECRAEFGRQREDADALALVAELRAGSADFAQWWDEQHVLDPEGGRRQFIHPEDGAVAYEQVNFLPTAMPGFRLVGLLPEPF
jgi:transcriptional regulator with XRE-family HTH domain